MQLKVTRQLQLPGYQETIPIKVELEQELAGFQDFGTATTVTATKVSYKNQYVNVPTYINEFWTAKQRAAHSLHEVSYRACFKPQLPRFFIERLTKPGDVVYDPFSGRGTTVLEAALLGRIPWACDINPLSRVLTLPRLNPPSPTEVLDRLQQIDLTTSCDAPADFLVFYHPDTLRAIANLRRYFLERLEHNSLDNVDAWIRMVAINRLTGHSSGFFSVYTLPPNQAVSINSQKKINEKRSQTPPFRDVRKIIYKKTRTLLSDFGPSDIASLATVRPNAQIVTGDCRHVPALESEQVQLIVTSPPFLDIVNYKQDNWLRCWFIGIDPDSVPIMHFRKLEDWARAMTEGFREHARLLCRGGHIAFEVGEIRNGAILLEETVVQCGMEAGLNPEMVLINDQEFTKTSNCWGVDNQVKGTNTNRLVLLHKE